MIDADTFVGLDTSTSLADQAARRAMENVTRQVEAGIIEAFRRGKDFISYPPTFSVPSPNSEPPYLHTVSIKGGPVEPGLDWPRECRVYRVRDLTPELRERYGI